MTNLAGLDYTRQEWDDAYEVAREWEWCDTDARENDGGGELAAFVATLYTHPKVERDEEILFAALQVIGADRTAWDSAFMEKVLDSYRGESEEELDKVAAAYIDSQWPGFPVEAIPDLAAFATKYAMPETEACAPGEDGGTLYYFDKNQW
ncbi:hypothetical protein ACWEDZ_02825 [Streptomyces sp. NPDC005047]